MTESVERIAEQVRGLESRIERENHALFDTVRQLRSTLSGNGQQGVMTRLTTVENAVARFSEAEDRRRKREEEDARDRRRREWAIILLLLTLSGKAAWDLVLPDPHAVQHEQR